MTKADYLSDVASHPRTTALEAAARLDVPESNVSEAFRRARKQQLIAGDGGRPEKFELTPAGHERLRVLQGEGPNAGANAPPAPSLQERLSALEETLGDVAEDVKVLFRFADRHLGIQREPVNPPDQDEDEIKAELLEQVHELEGQLDSTAKGLELYALELALAYGHLTAPTRSAFERYRDALASKLQAGVADQVQQLVEIEKQLTEENKKFFGPDDEKLRELEGEILKLRKKLGFAFERPSLADSEK